MVHQTLTLGTPSRASYTVFSIDPWNTQPERLSLVNQFTVFHAHRLSQGGSSLRGHSDALSWGRLKAYAHFRRRGCAADTPSHSPGTQSHACTPPRHELHVPSRDDRSGLIPLASDHLAYYSSPRVFSSGRSSAIRIYRLIRSSSWTR